MRPPRAPPHSGTPTYSSCPGTTPHGPTGAQKLWTPCSYSTHRKQLLQPSARPGRSGPQHGLSCSNWVRLNGTCSNSHPLMPLETVTYFHLCPIFVHNQQHRVQVCCFHGSSCQVCASLVGSQVPALLLVTADPYGQHRMCTSTVQVWTRSGAVGVPGSGPHQQCCPGPCTTQQTHLVAASHPWVTCTTTHHHQHRTHQTWHMACSSCCRSRVETTSSSCSSCRSRNNRCRW